MRLTSSAILTLLAVGVHGICDVPTTAITVVKIAGFNAALVTCKSISVQFNLPNSNAGRYYEYLKTQGIQCPAAGECLKVCNIDLAANPVTGLDDFLSGLKSACDTDRGTYGEKVCLKRDGQVKFRSNGCATSSLNTLVNLAEFNVASANCDNFSGRLDDANSKAGRYAEYVKAQDATCLGDPCKEECRIDFATGPGSSLTDLIGGLNSACKSNGGTYSNILLGKRDKQDKVQVSGCPTTVLVNATLSDAGIDVGYATCEDL